MFLPLTSSFSGRLRPVDGWISLEVNADSTLRLWWECEEQESFTDLSKALKNLPSAFFFFLVEVWPPSFSRQTISLILFLLACNVCVCVDHLTLSQVKKTKQILTNTNRGEDLDFGLRVYLRWFQTLMLFVVQRCLPLPLLLPRPPLCSSPPGRASPPECLFHFVGRKCSECSSWLKIQHVDKVCCWVVFWVGANDGG